MLLNKRIEILIKTIKRRELEWFDYEKSSVKYNLPQLAVMRYKVVMGKIHRYVLA